MRALVLYIDLPMGSVARHLDRFHALGRLLAAPGVGEYLQFVLMESMLLHDLLFLFRYGGCLCLHSWPRVFLVPSLERLVVLLWFSVQLLLQVLCL